MLTKKCTRCGEEKSIYDFYFYAKTDRFSCECKECKKKLNASYLLKKKSKGKTLTEHSKKCSRCGEIKPVSEFYFIKKTQKPSSECKACKSKLNAAYVIAEKTVRAYMKNALLEAEQLRKNVIKSAMKS